MNIKAKVYDTLGYYERHCTLNGQSGYNFWASKDANIDTTIYYGSDELCPDENGKYTLSEDEQKTLNNTIKLFQEGQLTRLENMGERIYEETSKVYNDLEFIVSRLTILPSKQQLNRLIKQFSKEEGL